MRIDKELSGYFLVLSFCDIESQNKFFRKNNIKSVNSIDIFNSFRREGELDKILDIPNNIGCYSLDLSIPASRHETIDRIRKFIISNDVIISHCIIGDSKFKGKFNFGMSNELLLVSDFYIRIDSENNVYSIKNRFDDEKILNLIKSML